MSTSPNVPVPGVTVTLSGNTSPGQGGGMETTCSHRRGPTCGVCAAELTAIRQRVKGLEAKVDELEAAREEAERAAAVMKADKWERCGNCQAVTLSHFCYCAKCGTGLTRPAPKPLRPAGEVADSELIDEAWTLLAQVGSLGGGWASQGSLWQMAAKAWRAKFTERAAAIERDRGARP